MDRGGYALRAAERVGGRYATNGPSCCGVRNELVTIHQSLRGPANRSLDSILAAE